ncbi:hypothetical protein ACEV7C_08875 [Enterobacter ludwigii]|uniref:hypothetical protein n=1 Tax=Enterobacter ludwigii TaxID=299767 RepID=UPI003BEEBD53
MSVVKPEGEEMSVKRYSVGYKDSASGKYAAMLDKQDGGYVSHDDYAALEQRLIESERYGRQTDITIDNLELKLAQMAAENAGLKESRQRLVEFIHEELDADYPLNMDIETQATDSFLAEVRAQGVEQLAKAWYAIANETDPGISISESSRLKYRQRADDAAEFANDIRQEAPQ